MRSDRRPRHRSATSARLLCLAALLMTSGCTPPGAQPEGEQPTPPSPPASGAADAALDALSPDLVPHGIDVSHHQGAVDWRTVASQPVHFVYVKASEGVDYVDPRFYANWRAARAVGLPVGAYHLYRPEDPADEQVANFVGALEAVRFGPGDLPPVLDIERVSSSDRVTPATLHDRAAAMLAEIHRQTGSRPMVYTNPSFWREYLTEAHDLTRYPLWVAEYRDDADVPDDPPGWSTWTFWQFSQEGRIEGVAKPVDRSRFNGDGAALAAFVRASHGAPAVGRAHGEGAAAGSTTRPPRAEPSAPR